MRVERPILVHGDPDAAPYWQMIDYVNQCEADIAELVEALREIAEVSFIDDKGTNDSLRRYARCNLIARAALAKHKGGQDE